MPKVLNARQAGKKTTETQVYIGRPSKWGNPFVISRDGTRADVIVKHREWIIRQPHLMAALGELSRKNLVCRCSPSPCHGDNLLQLANRYVCDAL